MKNIKVKDSNKGEKINVSIETVSITQVADDMRDFSKKDYKKLKLLARLYRFVDKLSFDYENLQHTLYQLRAMDKREFKRTFAVANTQRKADKVYESAKTYEELSRSQHLEQVKLGL